MPLYLASPLWSPEVVWLLIEHGADVNALDGNCKNPLHLASSSRCPKTMRLLTENGANVSVGLNPMRRLKLCRY